MVKKEREAIALSSSAITAFEHCPFQFFELRKNKSIEKVTDYLELGNMVHKALYHFHDANNTKSLIELFKEEWLSGSVADVDIYKAGLNMLEKYEVQFASDNEVLLREYRFELELLPGYYLRGVFDRVDKLNDNGDYEIIDYKTSLTPKSQDEVNSDLQLAIYDYAFHRLVEDGLFADSDNNTWPKPRNVYLSMLFLRYDKVTTIKSDEDRRVINDFLNITAKQINECTEPKKKLNPYCAWCLFKDGCEVYNLTPVENTFKQSIDFMDEEDLMKEYKRINYISSIVEERKKRISHILKTKLELLGLDNLSAGRYKCYLQRRSVKNYDVDKLRTVLEPLGLFSDVCKIKARELEKVAKDYGLAEIIDDATLTIDGVPNLRVKKL